MSFVSFSRDTWCFYCDETILAVEGNVSFTCSECDELKSNICRTCYDTKFNKIDRLCLKCDKKDKFNCRICNEQTKREDEVVIDISFDVCFDTVCRTCCKKIALQYIELCDKN